MKRAFLIILLNIGVIFNPMVVTRAQNSSSSINYQIAPLKTGVDNGSQSQSESYSISGTNSGSNISSDSPLNSEISSYYEKNDELSVSITPLRVDLGGVKPRQFLKGKSEINLFNNGAGLTLFITQNGPIKSFDEKEFVPPTQCNHGFDRCYIGKESLWDDVRRIGFGYRIVSTGVSFDKNYYRPFPDSSRGEKPTLLKNTSSSVPVDKISVEYQMAMSLKQPVGSYSGVVNYIVIPRF